MLIKIRTEIAIYVEEQSAATGTVKRVPASELYAFVSQAQIQQQLKQNLAAESCLPRTAMSGSQISQFLENAPSGNHHSILILFPYKHLKIKHPCIYSLHNYKIHGISGCFYSKKRCEKYEK